MLTPLVVGVGVDADILLVVYDQPATCFELGRIASAKSLWGGDDQRSIFAEVTVCKISDDPITAIETIVHETIHALVRVSQVNINSFMCCTYHHRPVVPL